MENGILKTTWNVITWPIRALWWGIKKVASFIPGARLLTDNVDKVVDAVTPDNPYKEIDTRLLDAKKQSPPKKWGIWKYIGALAGAVLGGVAGVFAITFLTPNPLSIPILGLVGFMDVGAAFGGLCAFETMRIQEKTQAEKIQAAQSVWGKMKRAFKKSLIPLMLTVGAFIPAAYLGALPFKIIMGGMALWTGLQFVASYLRQGKEWRTYQKMTGNVVEGMAGANTRTLALQEEKNHPAEEVVAQAQQKHASRKGRTKRERAPELSA